MHLGHGIYAIDTQFLRSGFDASHLIVHEGRAAFVDTGTTHSVPLLMNALAAIGLTPADVDFVLLTHVHLDHAGGAGALMRQLPAARAVLHPRGARHMSDPSRLIDGATAVYGAQIVAEHYGEILAIDAQRIHTVEDGERLFLGGRGLECIHTRGHAKHHYCIVDKVSGGIFTGDSFGVSYREFDTERGPFIFPTTTPVQFEPDQAHATIERLLTYRPRAFYLTHFSKVAAIERLTADLHECLDGFVEIARECAECSDRTAEMERRMERYLFERLDRHRFPRDPDARRRVLSADVRLNVQGLEVWLDRELEQKGH